MSETELRDVLLLRSLEREASALAPSDALAVGLAADLTWAGADARRRLGQPADGASAQAEWGRAWLAERARLGLSRCVQRWGADLPLGLASAVSGPGRALAGAVLVLAFLLGLVGDALGPSKVVNLLSLPLLGLLAWNLAVYALLLARALLSRWRRADRPPGPLRQALLAWLWRTQGRIVAQATDHPTSRGKAMAGSYMQWARVQGGFTRDWLAIAQPLHAARLAALVHAAAACLVLGVVASLYARGLVLDYRAGWDSTFLGVKGVHRLLSGLLGPASTLSGLALPDPAALASLRLAGGVGEGAARWIHLWALTLGLWVVLPRALLAAQAWAAARRLAANLALPPGADDLQRLLASASGGPQPVWVLPYNYQIDAAHQAALATLVGRRLGSQVELLAQPSLPLGAEDTLPAGLPEPAPTQVVLVMALTATPEADSHGAMVGALLAHLAGRCPLQVWVDESGWRKRLPGVSGAERRQQRRLAWSRLLATQGQAPVFVDLGPADEA